MAARLVAALGDLANVPVLVPQVLDAAASLSGTKILIHETSTPLGVCGQIDIYSDRAVIRIGPTVSAAHRAWIVFHEVGHLLCGHGESVAVLAARGARVAEPRLVDHMLRLNRGEGFQASEERQAERFALLVHERLRLRPVGIDASIHEALG